MAEDAWRVVILTSIPPVAAGYTQILRGLGHEPAAVIVPRGARGAPTPLAQAHVDGDPPELDVLFPSSRRSLAPLIRAYGADLALCTGFPWLIPADALEAPRLGIVNGHPSLLPRYRGPFPIAWAVRNGETEIGLTYHLMDAAFDTGNVLAQARIPLAADEDDASLLPKLEAASVEALPAALARLAAGDRGDAQTGGDYQSHFDGAYETIDLSHPAADVHRQVRAWSFVPPFAQKGPVLERNGRTVRVTRTSLTEVDGAERLDCGDGPLWLVDSVPV